jgi:hypothetical protein
VLNKTSHIPFNIKTHTRAQADKEFESREYKIVKNKVIWLFGHCFEITFGEKRLFMSFYLFTRALLPS